MANWTCITLFGSQASALDVDAAVSELEKAEFVFSRHVVCWLDGKLLDDPVGLSSSEDCGVASGVASLTRAYESIEIEFTWHGVLGSFGYEAGEEPTLALAAHGKMLRRLDSRDQELYWKAIERAAEAGGAAYGLSTADTADGIEERFIEIDGTRFLDVADSYWDGFLIEVWILAQNGGKRIDAPGLSEASISARVLGGSGTESAY